MVIRGSGNDSITKLPDFLHELVGSLRFAFLALLLDHPVAFAGRTFQPRPDDDVDLSALVTNQSGLLQRTGGNGDAGPALAQQVRQKFLGQRHETGIDTVLTHQVASK